MKKYDVVIVGAGPSGINCGIACQENGLSYVIIEKGLLVNSIYNFPVNMTFFSTSKKLEIGQVPFISHTDKPTRREALEYYRRIMEAYDLKIDFSTELIKIVSKKGVYELKTNKDEYLATNIILATGFYDSPRLLDVPGEQLVKVSHYYDDVHKYIRKNVVVVGAANSACDVALECWQKGANVTMIVRNETLYEKVKYWILPNIENRIKEGSIKAYFSSTITSISENAVEIDTPEGQVTINNDYVLAMTGYKPDMDWFRSLGINIHEETGEPELNLDTLESNIPRVFMAGVIVSGLQTSKLFIENTRDHAERIVKHIVNNK
ncbi:YpdA family putative bacillithiol disulfide reductase [Saprospiraceae bacterium]|nr:YpdA family putative bacillithiol disulfide reductase [Saprospiraceae bacterium]